MPTRVVPQASQWTCKSCRAGFQSRERGFSSTVHLKYATTANTPRRGNLPDTPARTRFAPSPTGSLHLGSIRTALYNYLLARATKGQFLLRIEDTDAKRTIPGAEDQLYKDLQWAGLQWDEGPQVGGPYGPYRQSERLPLYQKEARRLLEEGKAYRCFCTPDRLEALNNRRHAKGLPLGYDRHCQHSLSEAQSDEKAHAGEAHVLRFLSPDQWPRYNDLTYGRSQGHGPSKTKALLKDEPVYEDAILLKSDGFPTYHFANVVDDHLMRITHVVRGSEWMSSTPLHIALYDSLGFPPPAYAHVPLLIDTAKQKLSKRNFDSSLTTFSSQGIFPETLLNFAALLGWSHTQKRDVFTLPELEHTFDLKITKGNTIVNTQKLWFLQEQHAKRLIAANGPEFQHMVRALAVSVLAKSGAHRLLSFLGGRNLADVLSQFLRVESFSYRTPGQFRDEYCSIFLDPLPLPKDLPEPSIEDPSLFHPLRVSASTLSLIPSSHWTSPTLHAHLTSLQSTAPSDDISPKAWKKALYTYLRWTLLAARKGPGIAETLEILGREVCLARIQAANVRSREIEVERSRPVIKAAGFRGTVEGKRRIEKSWTGYKM